MKKILAGTAIIAAGLVGTAGVADAHFNEASGKAFGGQVGSPVPGDGAQGHWNGIENAACNGNTPFASLFGCD